MLRKSSEPKRRSSKGEGEAVDSLIRRCIRAGRFVPGQRLVEIDLMRMFNVSQRQVRDALRRLEAEGLVRIEKNRGAAVRKISRKEVSCILDVLDSLSLLAVRQAVRTVEDPSVRSEIEESLTATRQFRQQAKGEKRVQSYLDENVRFWDSIASVVDNPILWDIRERLETLLFRLQVQGLTINSDPEMWVAQHGEILGAILSKDVERTESLVLKASQAVREAILGLDDEVFS